MMHYKDQFTPWKDHEVVFQIDQTDAAVIGEYGGTLDVGRVDLAAGDANDAIWYRVNNDFYM